VKNNNNHGGEKAGVRSMTFLKPPGGKTFSMSTKMQIFNWLKLTQT